MSSRGCQHLVIDANIVQSAGERSAHRLSKSCRSFLVAVRSGNFHVVVTTPILEEWKRHETQFSRIWHRSMAGRKRICRRRDIGPDVHLRRRVLSNVQSQEVEATKKDVHLLEAALATDSHIGSSDEVARNRFSRVSREVSELATIVWINPTAPREGAVNWLKNGAPSERQRMLGPEGENG